jgi:hypothetical protein
MAASAPPAFSLWPSLPLTPPSPAGRADWERYGNSQSPSPRAGKVTPPQPSPSERWERGNKSLAFQGFGAGDGCRIDPPARSGSRRFSGHETVGPAGGVGRTAVVPGRGDVAETGLASQAGRWGR